MQSCVRLKVSSYHLRPSRNSGFSLNPSISMVFAYLGGQDENPSQHLDTSHLCCIGYVISFSELSMHTLEAFILMLIPHDSSGKYSEAVTGCCNFDECFFLIIETDDCVV